MQSSCRHAVIANRSFRAAHLRSDNPINESIVTLAESTSPRLYDVHVVIVGFNF